MPDFKTELQKLDHLQFDDSPEDTPAQPEPAHQGSISEQLFNLVRDNPGLRRKEVLLKADAAGISRASSSSLLVQFVRREIVKQEKGPGGLCFTAVGDSYRAGYVRRKPKVVSQHSQTAPTTPDITASVGKFTVSELLSNMSIVQAKLMYAELKAIFESDRV